MSFVIDMWMKIYEFIIMVVLNVCYKFELDEMIYLKVIKIKVD